MPDKTEKNIVTAIVIPTLAFSDTFNTDAISTPNDIPAKSPINVSKRTNGRLPPKSTLITNFKNAIKIAIPTRLTIYEPTAELSTIILFLLGDTEILFPLLLIFAKQVLIAVSPRVPPYKHAIAIKV